MTFDHFENNNKSNNCIKNISTNAVIEQSNVISVSTFSIFSQRKHFLHSKKQISLREKLILWTDRYKIGQRS